MTEPVRPKPYIMPNRKWIPARNGGWTSREWHKGEKEAAEKLMDELLER